jgi:23S rRNA pseudouridine1911/1915/1917 synthase
MQELVYHIDQDEAGGTVGGLLRRKGFSRTLIRGLKRAGQVLLNGVPVYMREPVSAGDILTVKLPPDGATILEPERHPLEILYEDADLLAVNKPAGMLVHPVGCEQRGTLANAVLYHWRVRGVKARFRPVYRLDRDTSGIVLVAVGHFAAQQLARQLTTGTLCRRYLAVVEGLPDSRGTVDLPLALQPGTTARWMVAPGGKRAVTHYRVIRKLRGTALLSLGLETGRTHQIRVHMSHVGHPLVGDALYGGDTALLDRQALHAAVIAFNHPRTGVPVKLCSPLPADMRGLVQQLLP